MRVGIVGLGYVGKAVQASWLGTDNTVLFHDPVINGSVSIQELLDSEPHVIFVCVPTPSNPDGSCDTSTVRITLNKLSSYKGHIVVKSTTDPVFWKQYEGVENLWHIPEFLVAKNAIHDYLNPKFIFVGGTGDNVFLLNVLSQSAINTTGPILFTDLITASLVKYFMNTFLANKVIMMNQYKILVDSLGGNWEHFTGMLKTDTRMGDSHFDVPGPDGSLGYGGACFPKDVRAIIDLLQRTDNSIGILEAVENANNIIRK
jgi:UDPglucose 6-dehydrogenase